MQKIGELKSKLGRIHLYHANKKEGEKEVRKEDAEEESLDDSFGSDLYQEMCSEERPSDTKAEKKCKGYLKIIRNSLNEEKDENQKNSHQDPHKVKSSTPDFGARTPTSVDDDKISSL